MLTAMIFANAGDMASRIQRRCINSGDISLFRSPEYRPTASDMVRLINSYSPELVFIEVHDQRGRPGDRVDGARRVSDVGLMGFSDNWDGRPGDQGTGGSLRIIPSTIAAPEFLQQVTEVMEGLNDKKSDNIIVFLPAKAGSGASTVALNVCGALANKCGKSTILIEADLHSGPAGMYLNLEPKYSVVDALQESHRLESVWNDMVTAVQNFTILPAFSIGVACRKPSPWAYRRLLTFTRIRYEHVIFDLPEVVNQATEAIVSSARTVYVVCTPEVPSLMLARKRCAALTRAGCS